MPFQTAATKTVLRAALKADIRAGWFGGEPAPADTSLPYATHGSAPEVPVGIEALPRAFLYLRAEEPESEEGALREVGARFHFEATLQFPKTDVPAGSTLEDTKDAKVDAFTSRVISGVNYQGYNREWEGTDYGDPDAEAEGEIATVTVRIAIDAAVPGV